MLVGQTGKCCECVCADAVSTSESNFFVFKLCRRASELTVETPKVECDDGDTISPLRVTFVQGNGRSCWQLVHA